MTTREKINKISINAFSSRSPPLANTKISESNMGHGEVRSNRFRFTAKSEAIFGLLLKTYGRMWFEGWGIKEEEESETQILVTTHCAGPSTLLCSTKIK